MLHHERVVVGLGRPETPTVPTTPTPPIVIGKTPPCAAYSVGSRRALATTAIFTLIASWSQFFTALIYLTDALASARAAVRLGR
ncbi:hypothetical protein [Microbacterium sp. CPCC 204701]|uniref:hypothetical protein n=1 Tax=Microbacterium sp. CPCC 204701 TaxID=2493084 RepID=UPI003159664C